jgi:hypothetical protein
MTWQYNPERGDITDPAVPQAESSISNPETYAYYGGDLICETVRSTHGPLLANSQAMLKALKNLYFRIKNGYLVRNTESDSSPNFHLEAMKFVLELKEAQGVIEKAEIKEGCDV